jgi:cell division protein FtsI (penicillin-binding protein 3)
LPGKAAKSELFNKFTLGVYEPGSIFKIFSMAALIESGDFSMSDKFDVREPLKRDYFTIRDYHPKKRVLQLPEVFIYSSNIGSALIGERLGRERLKNFYDDLGFFDAPLYINIPETGRPLLPDPWRTTSTLTVSYGHGISVSPLQIISAVSTVIGDGTYVRPVFLCRDNTDSGEKYVPPSPELRVVSPETVLRMRQLMRLAVTDGTGSKAEVPGYQVGGKTGTAEKAENGVYVHNRLLSSFVGVFPMKDPKYAVLIMIDEPEGTQESHGYATGGWVAAPAVGHVIASMGALLGIPVQGTEQDQLAAPLRKYVKPEGKERHFASY